MSLNTIDGFIFCRSCYAAFGDSPGPQTELSGYLNILPSQLVSDSIRPEYISCLHPFRTATILCPYIRHMGERAFVSELTYQPYLCSVGDIVTAIGTPIRGVYSATRTQPPETGAGPRVLFRRR